MSTKFGSWFSTAGGFAAALAVLVIITGCSGDTGDNSNVSDDSRSDDIFLAQDAGSIVVSPTSTSFAVGGTTGFFATVKGADGTPQPDVQVTCDSEQGIAIVEPSTGTGLTDGFGNYSGVIGCAAPGSFRFGCRTPGIGLRNLVTILCTGDIPAGFVGFPGAAGGSLGGGVSDVDDGVTGDSMINYISIADLGEFPSSDSSTLGIDIVAGTCDDGSPEPFFETTVGFLVVNNSNSAIRFTKMRYQVENVDSSGSQFNSNEISIIGQTSSSVASQGGENFFSALFLTAVGGGKRFIGASSNISFVGSRNVTFRLFGTTAGGEDVVISGRIAVSFNNFGNCS